VAARRSQTDVAVLQLLSAAKWSNHGFPMPHTTLRIPASGVTTADTLMISKRDGAQGAIAIEPPGYHKEADNV
jgi:hypothetical protein